MYLVLCTRPGGIKLPPLRTYGLRCLDIVVVGVELALRVIAPEEAAGSVLGGITRWGIVKPEKSNVIVHARSLRVSVLPDDSKATPSMTNSREALEGKCWLDLDEASDAKPPEALALFAMAGLIYFLCAMVGLTYFLLTILELA